MGRRYQTAKKHQSGVKLLRDWCLSAIMGAQMRAPLKPLNKIVL